MDAILWTAGTLAAFYLITPLWSIATEHYRWGWRGWRGILFCYYVWPFYQTGHWVSRDGYARREQVRNDDKWFGGDWGPWYRVTFRWWWAKWQCWRKPTVCRFCGTPCDVRQVPCPIPVSDAYCADCAGKCREHYEAMMVA